MVKRKPIKKVLILEDEKELARLYVNKLVEEGFNVKLFEDPQSLVEACGAFKPDIAFLDHTLHDTNATGLSVVPALKKSNPEIVIVMLSNYSAFQMEKEAKKAGVTDYLLKIDTPPTVLVNYIRSLSN